MNPCVDSATIIAVFKGPSQDGRESSLRKVLSSISPVG